MSVIQLIATGLTLVIAKPIRITVSYICYRCGKFVYNFTEPYISFHMLSTYKHLKGLMFDIFHLILQKFTEPFIRFVYAKFIEIHYIQDFTLVVYMLTLCRRVGHLIKYPLVPGRFKCFECSTQ